MGLTTSQHTLHLEGAAAPGVARIWFRPTGTGFPKVRTDPCWSNVNWLEREPACAPLRR